MAKSAKKVLSVFIAVLMIASMAVMAIPTASAASPSFSGGKIYWELPEAWAKAATFAYAHVYGHNGETLYDWQTKNEKMTDEGNGVWSYDVPAGSYDLVTFSIDTGVQTTDLVLSDDNIGMTAVTDTNTTLENPMDSNKTGSRTTWKETGGGVHFTITSIGNLIGDDLCPTEDGAEVVGNFIKNYFPTQPEYVTKDVIEAAMGKCNTDANAVISYLEGISEFTQVEDIKTLLGVNGGGSDNNNNDNNTDNSNNNDNNNSNNTGGTTSNNSSKNNSSTGGTRTNSSTTSTTSSGTTTTGDSTPFVVLAIVLVASLGVAVVAAKKKVSE